MDDGLRQAIFTAMQGGRNVPFKDRAMLVLYGDAEQRRALLSAIGCDWDAAQEIAELVRAERAGRKQKVTD